MAGVVAGRAARAGFLGSGWPRAAEFSTGRQGLPKDFEKWPLTVRSGGFYNAAIETAPPLSGAVDALP
jgi:hypothetical protein